MRLLYGQDQAVSSWVACHIPHMMGESFGPMAAIGVVSMDGDMLAGVVFHDYQKRFKTMQISMAAVSPKWATRNTIRLLLSYPFLRAGVEKVWTAMPHTNERAIRFNKGIGFVQEAVLAYQFGSSHAVICRLLRKDYLRIYEVAPDGQKFPLPATGT